MAEEEAAADEYEEPDAEAMAEYGDGLAQVRSNPYTYRRCRVKGITFFSRETGGLSLSRRSPPPGF
jgi:hypothetical protein